MISVGYLQLGLSKGQELRGSVDAKRALYIAEAGLAEAFLALSTGKSGNIANSILPARYANGLVWVEATESANGRVQSESTGMVGTGRTSVSIVVEPLRAELGALGLFGADSVRVGPPCSTRLGAAFDRTLHSETGSERAAWIRRRA
ncbi:MAG: hypothetical protein ACKVWV_15470 [Planctomycetota bacterium]